jgi:4-aminobutyrate aminotransferase-like enzyme
VVRFAPPLVLTKPQSDSIVAIFDAALTEVEHARRPATASV